MERFVLDASVSLAWCFPEENAALAGSVLERLESAQASVPAIWVLEVANALLVAERRQRITVAESGNFRELLRALAIEVDSLHPERVWGENLALARLYGLSVYDASYLELAIRRRLPLATLDGKLKAAARAAQVEIVS